MQNNTVWEKELALIASIIAKAPLEKTIKWGTAVFTHNGNNVVSYGGFKNHFAIWFYQGVFLKDPGKVLVSAQEGKTKALRQWRFTSIEEIDEQKILEYIREAIDIAEKGLKIQAESFSAIPVAPLLDEALKADTSLQTAFEKLSPGRQKEYSVFINEAKQETTKRNRLEKIKPMISGGKGLNDQYKSSK